MERHYGKGLVGMFHPETGKFDKNRLGWARHGRKLGASLEWEITPGFTVDGTTLASGVMGDALGTQWDGLASNTAADQLTDDGAQLSNCFASTYSQLESIDQIVYDWETILAVDGTFKGLDVFLNDPVKILADNVVTYEMCDFGTIIDQIKLMASLDWSSLADNVVRETMVLAIDLPESLDLMDQIEEAGKCANRVATGALDTAQGQAGAITDDALSQAEKTAAEAIALEEAAKKAAEEAEKKAKEAEDKAKKAADEAEKEGEKEKEKQEEKKDENVEEEWWTFATDPSDRAAKEGDQAKKEGEAVAAEGEKALADGQAAVDGTIDGVTDSIDGIADSATGAATGALDDAKKCVDFIDEFSVGKLGGKVFAKLFNNEVKPLQ